MYSLYWAKEITKKVYNNIVNSIKVEYKLDTIFMNSRNTKTSDPHRLFLNRSICYTWKNIKKPYKYNRFEI